MKGTDMDKVREALAELVELKDLHDRCENMPSEGDCPAEPEAQAMWQEYRRRKPLAWAAAREALSVQPARQLHSVSSIDIERMLAECVPGGSSCDPQQVADAIRRYCNAWQPADPMDTPLPCDVKVGNGTHRKGTSLRTLVARMKMLHEAAFGPEPTQAEKDANLAVLQGAQPAPSVPAVPEGWQLVPKEPTTAMLDKGAMQIAMNHQRVQTAEASARCVYRAMLAAAPLPAAKGGAE